MLPNVGDILVHAALNRFDHGLGVDLRRVQIAVVHDAFGESQKIHLGLLEIEQVRRTGAADIAKLHVKQARPAYDFPPPYMPRSMRRGLAWP